MSTSNPWPEGNPIRHTDPCHNLAEIGFRKERSDFARRDRISQGDIAALYLITG